MLCADFTRGSYASLSQAGMVAQTVNIHLDNDAVQANAFDPLKDDSLTVNGGVDIAGHHFGGHDAHTTTGTTAPGNQASNGGGNYATDGGSTDSGSTDSGSTGGDQQTTTEAPGPLGQSSHGSASPAGSQV